MYSFVGQLLGGKGNFQPRNTGVNLQHVQHQHAFFASLGCLHRHLAHLGSLFWRHREFSCQSNVSSHRADLVLLRWSAFGQVQQDRRGINAVPLAQQLAASIL
jgi:hypothetical protein